MARRLVLVPLFLTVHNAEEAAFMRGALAELPVRVDPRLAPHVPPYREFVIALAAVTIVPWVLWLLRRDRRAVWALIVVQAVMLVNVASHVASAIAMRGYAPGVVTALAINLPFSIYLLRTAVRQRWVGSMVAVFATALVLHGPGLLGMFAAIRALSGR